MSKVVVGDQIPDFVFDKANASGVHLHQVLKGKTVLWVLRYIGCTVCRYDVHLIQQNYQKFVDKGAQVFVVMQSDVPHIQKDLEGVDLPFDIICDPQMNIYKTLEILPAASKEELLGDGLEKLQKKGAAAAEAGFSHGDYEGDESQLPALFIVEEDAKISYAHYAKSIMDMPTVNDVLEML